MKRRINKKAFALADRAGFWGKPLSSGLLIVVALLLMAVSSLRPGLMEGARLTVNDLVAPVLSVVAKPVQDFALLIRDISGLASLQAEIADLRAENAQLKNWYKTALHLQTENNALRGLLNMQPAQPHKTISARILSDSGNAFVKTILIDAGLEQDIRKNQSVLSDQGLIGRVIETGRTSARILLVNDVNSRVPVMIEGTNLNAILKGENTHRPILKHLPEDITLDPGMAVFTSGQGGVFPAGLPVGTVEKTNLGYEVHLYTEFSGLSFVRIIDTAIDFNYQSASDLE